MDTLEATLAKALREPHLRNKRVLLNKVLAMDPDCPEALKALLLLGRLGEAGTKSGDYSAVRSFSLNVFDQPERYQPDEIDSIIADFTNGKALQDCLRVFPDREGFLKEYLAQICNEYVRVFMEGDNHRNGSLMGIRLGGHKNRMAGYAARMLCRVQESHLPAPFDTLLLSALLDAFDRCWDNRTLIRQLAHWDA